MSVGTPSSMSTHITPRNAKPWYLISERSGLDLLLLLRTRRTYLWAPPSSTVWHWLHLVLKILAPFFSLMVVFGFGFLASSTRLLCRTTIYPPKASTGSILRCCRRRTTTLAKKERESKNSTNHTKITGEISPNVHEWTAKVHILAVILWYYWYSLNNLPV